jgi:hypothetical protein
MSHRFPFPSPIRLDFPAASQPRYPFRFPVPLPEERRNTASVKSRTEFAINEGDRSWHLAATPTLQSVSKSDCVSIGCQKERVSPKKIPALN